MQTKLKLPDFANFVPTSISLLPFARPYMRWHFIGERKLFSLIRMQIDRDGLKT